MRHFHAVGTFHEKFGLDNVTYHGVRPRGVDRDLMLYRLNFLAEELREIANGMGFNCTTELEYGGHPISITDVADGLVDLEYVTLGTAHFFGLPWGELFDEVQRANMQKERAVNAEQSVRKNALDVVKPAGWQAPDIKGVLTRFGWRP